MSDKAEQTLETLGGIALGAIFEDYEGAPPLNAVEDAASGKLVEVDAPTGDTPVAVEQPRDAQGRFIQKEDPEGYTEEVPVEEAPEAPAEEQPDDSNEEEVPADVGIAPEAESAGDEIILELDADIVELLDSKYGGDISAALRGLKEAQSLIGRQGTELGNTRAENEALRELADRFTNLENRMTPFMNDVDEEPSALAQEIVERVMATGDTRLLDSPLYRQAITNWGDEDPFSAAEFSTTVRMARMQADQLAQPAQPPATFEGEMEALKSQFPDLPQRLPAIQAEAAKRPALARLLSDEDPQTRVAALKDLYQLSAGAGTPDTSAAARQIILRARAEADAAKDDAAVVSASNTTPPPAKPQSGDDRLAAVLQNDLGLGDDFKIVG